MTTSSLINLLGVLRKLEAEVLASMPTGLLVGRQVAVGVRWRHFRRT